MRHISRLRSVREVLRGKNVVDKVEDELRD
jgi:hypothetical protein